ncbi:MAG: Hsp20/alpha crystallin family protein [Pseudomonadota bacterium]
MFRSEYPLLRRGRLFGEEMLPFPRSIQRALESFMQDMWEPSTAAPAMAFYPQVDVDEDEKQVRVVAELPGMQESDVEVVYEPGCLILRGEKRTEERREARRGRGRYEELRYGSFERRIPLTAEIDESAISANFDRGVLTVSLAKTAEARAQARRIPVKAERLIEQSPRGRPQQPSEGASAH